MQAGRRRGLQILAITVLQTWHRQTVDTKMQTPTDLLFDNKGYL